MSTDALVAQLLTGATSVQTTLRLYLRLLHRRKLHTWYYNPGQKPVTEEVVVSRVEPATVILLSGHLVKFSSTHFCLYLQNWPPPSLVQRSLVGSSQR